VVAGHVGQFAQRLQLGELGVVARIGEAAGPESVAEAERHVELREYLADGLELGVVNEAARTLREADSERADRDLEKVERLLSVYERADTALGVLTSSSFDRIMSVSQRIRSGSNVGQSEE